MAAQPPVGPDYAAQAATAATPHPAVISGGFPAGRKDTEKPLPRLSRLSEKKGRVSPLSTTPSTSLHAPSRAAHAQNATLLAAVSSPRRGGKKISASHEAGERNRESSNNSVAAQSPAHSNPLAFLASEVLPPNTPQEVLLEVHINGQDGYGTATLISLDSDPNKKLYASDSDLKQWRLRIPDVSPRDYDGKKFYPLSAIPGLDYHVDNSTSTLWITATAKDFAGTTVIGGLARRNPQPQHTPVGGFFDYDFLGSAGGPQTTVNGLFTIGIFNNWGTGTSDFLDENFGRAHSHLIRLDTAWRHDNVQNMTSLTLGDTYTRGGTTNLAVNMGGIQFGTNFSTQPYLITYPLPTLSGETTLPSTAQLYVNGLLKKTTQIPPGTFTLPDIPTQTQNGNVRLVLRDPSGHEQIITTSFYASSQLLKPGLNDYSVSFGKLRENYGLESNDYGDTIATGLFRHGFNDFFTGGISGEMSKDLQDVGLDASVADIATGELDTGLAVSHSPLGNGVLGSFGFRRQWKVISVNASLQLASPRFTQLGYYGNPAPRKQVVASLSAFFGRPGSFSLSYLDQDNQTFGRVRLINAGYTVNVGHVGSLIINAYHSLSGSANNEVSLTFSMSFGGRTSMSSGIVDQNGSLRGYAQVQRSLPVGTGSGYHVYGGLGPYATNSAEYDYQNSVGTWRAGVLQSGGDTIYQGEASGGISLLDGDLFFSRKITNSFGLVEVPGLANVTVYSHNQPVAVTDKHGYALLPSLLAYQNNPIDLSAENLPLSTQIGTLEINAVPRYRSAVVVKFPVLATNGATFTIKLENGKPLPTGATVQIVGEKRTFPVGLDGEVYVAGLAPHNKLEADWNGQHCEIEVAMPKTKDPLPDLGTFVCKGVKP